MPLPFIFYPQIRFLVIVKKLKKIEVSFPLANYPMPCPQCEKSLWRFDMQKHVTKIIQTKSVLQKASFQKRKRVFLRRNNREQPMLVVEGS
eukprot:UN22015